jgi:hypothetical protein
MLCHEDVDISLHGNTRWLLKSPESTLCRLSGQNVGTMASSVSVARQWPLPLHVAAFPVTQRCDPSTHVLFLSAVIRSHCDFLLAPPIRMSCSSLAHVPRRTRTPDDLPSIQPSI